MLFVVALVSGCANIVPPSGGKKDVRAPRIVSVDPADSLRNVRTARIVFHFDEYVTLTDVSKEVQISPILPIVPLVTGVGKKVTIKIVDSLLQANTTYRISFGNAVRDLHEGNIFKNYTYTFSTGGYFDSLQLMGHIINAVTGLPDTGDNYILLYDAARPDSAIVREKPLYVVKSGTGGTFSLKGLPARVFRIYALKDANGNLIYDGDNEWIGFHNKTVRPGDTSEPPINIRIFPEVKDTTKGKPTDKIIPQGGPLAAQPKPSVRNKEGFNYSVDVDTLDVRKRTKDITKPVYVVFNKKIAGFNKDRINLSYDSSGISVEASVTLAKDTAHSKLSINTAWQDNTVYTLRLLKGFMKDTAGADALPSRFTFRTLRDEDYGQLHIHLPPKYVSPEYLLLVKNEKDTVYKKPIADTMINLLHLSPSTYTILLVVDKNGNGKWDTGNLFAKQQPEMVIPYTNTVVLKAGWDNIIDFEPAIVPSPRSPGGKPLFPAPPNR
ncbi:MAG: Ig-like domain-containing protein [Taibaiella sp.]|nr:Ig-like domain-containing protein [Taibaiella sp.]